MSLLRQKIMDSAIRFFTEKGYASTSIQDIVNDCGIAKGSLYKFFASKEDLLIEVFELRFQRMFEEAEKIKADGTLSSRERLIRETLHQFEFFTLFKLNIHEIQDLPLQEEGRFTLFIQRLRAGMLNYYKDCFLRAYGAEMEPYIWDLTAFYIAILKEYTVFTIFVNQPVDKDKTALFIVDRMDDIAAGIIRAKPQPILQASVMSEFIQCGLDGSQVPPDKFRACLLQSLLTSVQELSTVPHTRITELNEAALLLKEETEKDQPKRILIRALLELLRSQHELKNIVGQLDKILGS